MKHVILFLFFGVILISELAAQEINAYKTFGGVRFMRDTTELSMSQVMSILKDNQNAYTEIKKAKGYSNAAAITGFCGAVMLAFPAGTALAGGEPEWGFVAGGAILIITSIPLLSAYRNHTMNALDFFNDRKTARFNSHLFLTPTAAKLVIRF